MCARPAHLCIVLRIDTPLFSGVGGWTCTYRVSLTRSLNHSRSLFWSPGSLPRPRLRFRSGLDFSLRLYEQYEYLYYCVPFVVHVIRASLCLGCFRVQQCLIPPHITPSRTSSSSHIRLASRTISHWPSRVPYHTTYHPYLTHTMIPRRTVPSLLSRICTIYHVN